VAGAARAWRRVAPWSRWSPPPGAFGLPFLDHARGDGTAVGPGGDRPWDVCVVTDSTPWVRDYRGLWGLDTHDVLGGERAPAGPRYDRGGTVRMSWADPVGWAGLRGEPPDGAAAVDHLRVSVDALAARVAELDGAVADGQAALRRATVELRSLGVHVGLRRRVAAGRAAPAQQERELAALCAERARLADELAVHRAHLDAPALLTAPAPALPEPGPAPAVRRGTLRVWAALSTPLLLVSAVVLLVGPVLFSLTATALVVVLFLAVEAAARGRLLSFLLGLALTAATVAAGVLLVLGLLQNWRVVLAVLLSAVALVLLVANVRELRR
jgi:hypothetical protein